MPDFTDALGRTIELHQPPKRIVSLVPSQTELLFDLGLREEVVGITKFCIHPDWAFRSKPRVGGTKTVHLHRVRDLQPDLIIANKEENVREQVEQLAAEFPVWVSDVNNVDEALVMIRTVGELTGRVPEASELATRIGSGFCQLKPLAAPLPAAYLIWRDPYMTAGPDTFIHDVMLRAGLQNIVETPRYPEVTVEALSKAGCRIVLLSSEPYPFREKHMEELAQQLPGVSIRLVDGEVFSWYGSRLLHTPAYLQGLVGGLGSIG